MNTPQQQGNVYTYRKIFVIFFKSLTLKSVGFLKSLFSPLHALQRTIVQIYFHIFSPNLLK